MYSQEYNTQTPYLSDCAVHRVPLHKSTRIPAFKSTSTKTIFSFQFYTIFIQNRSFNIGSFETHHLYQLIEKVMGIYQNFNIFHSLLDLSLIFLSEHETISKISIKASKFTTPRAFSINKQCVPYVYRQLHCQQHSDQY